MKTRNKKLTMLLILLVILIAVVLVFFFGSRKEKIKHVSRAAGTTQTAKPAKEIQMKTTTLFFLSDKDGFLHPEEREIRVSSLNDEARALVEELIKGPRSGLISAIPENTRVRQVFVTPDGTAYVDLSRELLEANFYGSSGEMAVVYSIVDSLAFNFKRIKKISLLVEGNEKETLGGHIDLSRPFLPDYSLVAR
jgi:spore germination protein GerM